MIRITPTLSISEEELSFTTSRSGGPGGQNVNKVNTRVMLLFDVENSTSLSEKRKRSIKRRLSRRVNRAGILRVVSQKHRSQSANKKAAMQAFVELLSEALRVRKSRKKTKIPEVARRKRREEKAQRSQLKQKRSKVVLPDE